LLNPTVAGKNYYYRCSGANPEKKIMGRVHSGALSGYLESDIFHRESSHGHLRTKSGVNNIDRFSNMKKGIKRRLSIHKLGHNLSTGSMLNKLNNYKSEEPTGLDFLNSAKIPQGNSQLRSESLLIKSPKKTDPNTGLVSAFSKQLTSGHQNVVNLTKVCNPNENSKISLDSNWPGIQKSKQIIDKGLNSMKDEF
jgi:hypothetical protein